MGEGSVSISNFHNHRVIVEWEQYSNQKIRIKTFIDGNTNEESLLLRYDSGLLDFGSPSAQDLIMAQLNQHIPYYKNISQVFSSNFYFDNIGNYNIRLAYNCKIGCFSFFYGELVWGKRPNNYIDFLYLNDSWGMLRGDNSYCTNYGTPFNPLNQPVLTDCEHPSFVHLSDRDKNGRLASKDSGSLIYQFDRFMMNGTDHIKVKMIEISDLGDRREVKITFGNIFLDSSPYSQIRKGDWIELGRTRQPLLNRKWKVHNVGNNFITFQTNYDDLLSEDCRMNVVVVKKLAVRETGYHYPEVYSWTRSGSGQAITYSIISKPFSFTITESNVNDNAVVTSISSIVPESLWLKSCMKDDFSILHGIRSSAFHPKILHWQVLGTPEQLIMSLGYARDALTHHHLLTLGWYKDLITSDWTPLFQSYKSSNFGDPGQTFAFTFRDWTLLESGHIICEKQDIVQPSDAKWIQQKSDEYVNFPGKNDLGFHMYPITIPKILY